MSQQQNQTIRKWSLTGDDRIFGAVYNRPGHRDGRPITTSPVVRVLLMGAEGHPVALTESGSIYWLGEPCESFGIDAALAFIREKSGAAQLATEPPDSELRTTMAAALTA